MNSWQLSLFWKILLLFAAEGIAWFISVMIKHFFLTHNSEMKNVPSADLKFSKKRCDFVNGFFCLVICFIQIAGGLWYGFNIVPCVFRRVLKPFILCFALFVLSIPGTIFAAFAKTSKSAAFWAGGIYFLQSAAFIILDDNGWRIVYETYYIYYICMAALIMMSSMRKYNQRLKDLKGYPYFSDYEGKRVAESKDTYRDKEKGNLRLSHLSAEEFFNMENDLHKLAEEPEPDDAPIDTSVMNFDEYYDEVNRQRQEREFVRSSDQDEAASVDVGSYYDELDRQRQEEEDKKDKEYWLGG